MDKLILLAAFIFPERLEWFLTYLESRYRVSRERVFTFENLDDESKLIVTFRLLLRDGKKIDLKRNFPSAMIIHKRGDTLYTINALNKLIEQDFDLDYGNINYGNYEIDWSKYQNKMIVVDDDELNMINIKQVFL